MIAPSRLVAAALPLLAIGLAVLLLVLSLVLAAAALTDPDPGPPLIVAGGSATMPEPTA